MKLFISYAHVDEYRVRELVDILRDASHDPWFDHRLMVGRAWEDQLLEAIETCERFLYALTPESVESKWCQWEFVQAVHAGKPVVPVLMQEKTPLTGILDRIQYADFSQGPVPRAVAKLLGGITTAQVINPADVPLLDPPHAKPERPVESENLNVSLAVQLYDDAYEAFRAKDYGEALELLHDCLLIDAHHAEAQKLLVVVERRQERAPKGRLTRIRSTRSKVLDVLPGPFKWIEIPAGRVTLITEQTWAENYIPKSQSQVFEVATFDIAKYPITNAQFAPFVEAGGYCERKWWTEAGWAEREIDGWTEPRYWQDGQWNGDEQPVVGVSWYEAIAYCRWLSEVCGEPIVLPTEQQWQRAAQGDSGHVYPWGNEWDGKRCNNSVEPEKSDRTMPVFQYERHGDSLFGVVDLVGNVWEWCLTLYETGSNDINGTDARVLRGGSWKTFDAEFLRVFFRNWDSSIGRNFFRGFRCIRSSKQIHSRDL